MAAAGKVFTQEDFNSNDGMMTYVWGPALWHTLHTMSFNYPVNPTPEQRKHYKEFVFSLQNVLPCGACRENLKKNLEKVPLTASALRNRRSFSHWMYRLHEEVNTMLGKKSGLTYEDVRDRYENFRARCGSVKKAGAKEKGCVEPLVGIKSKCVINIIPKANRRKTFTMDKKCQTIRKSNGQK